MDRTLYYYEDNAADFFAGTVNVDFGSVADRFAAGLPEGGLILDFGCGSGRDAAYFLRKGFRVEAVDGSPELCRYASDYAGIPARCMRFQELDEREKYDGIWACASLLHVEKRELPDVFRRMLTALKTEGILYASFKYGDFEGERNGRYFSDFTEKSFRAFLTAFPQLQIMDEWISSDVRPGREKEKWLNVIMRAEP